ncbi:non-ribosomal peptide synthetase [Burkholderia sp. TSV86]|uniref:non-ribosomal peptide synthetase n=1 Tax=Burkholderia sp. TSV86 TaxID=1385594 RepID=UPI0009E77FB1|nr:non-ribosomal peptide synthetase [Burkholderia sp. TSV86]
MKIPVDGIKLTTAQLGIWYGQAVAPESSAYHVAEYFDINGPLDPDVLEAALSKVIEESPTLSVRFEMTPDGPLQFARPHHCRLVRIDLSTKLDSVGEAKAWMHNDVVNGSKVNDPLFLFALLTISSNRCFFYHRYHHVIIDYHGAMVIAGRIAALYSQILGIPTHRRRFARPLESAHEFFIADATYVGSEAEARDRKFWHDKLDGWEGRVSIGGQLTVPMSPSLAAEIALPDGVTARLVNIAKEQRVTLAQVTMAVTAIWLNALTGQTDLVFGVAISSSRALRLLAPTVSSNVLPLRLQLSADQTMIDLAREAALFRKAARSHDGYRGERLALDATGTAGLFGPMVNVVNFNYDLRFAGLRAYAHNLSIGPVDDVCVTVYDRHDGRDPQFVLNVNIARHAPDQISRFTKCLRNLLIQLARHPNRPLHDLNLLSFDEHETTSAAHNLRPISLKFESFPSLFEKKVAVTPNARCVVADGFEYTYIELNNAANRMARELVVRGVTSGKIVAILLYRSATVVTALLAAMKVGAAYTLIDPELPSRRIVSMLSSITSPILLTTHALSMALPLDTNVIIYIDDPNFNYACSQQPGDDLAQSERIRPIMPNDPAYVIFTSGSTGQPKGVVVPHRGLSSLVATLLPRLHVYPSSRFMQFSALSFDALVLEILLTFSAGACLFMPRDDERHGAALGEFLNRNNITHAMLPPASLVGLDPQIQEAPGTLLVGGEVCPSAIAAAWSKGRRMFNLYGPAEATICVTVSDSLKGSDVPIGLPIINTRLYVLDAFGRLVPEGITGELYIAGEGLALGYINRPELTAECFIACPFEAPGTRMYRTGDLVCRRNDGTLEFIGRVDRQIKLRGFRVELGEIETALGRLSSVTASCVTPYNNGHSDTMLVGYVVLRPGSDADVDTIREHLASSLPYYMVPTVIIALSELPTTVNGKVNLSALPAPISSADTPTTSSEQTLAELFSLVLQRKSVGCNDSFFALGGDSLKAMLLATRIRERFGVDLSLATIFSSPTVTSLARKLAHGTASAVSPTSVVLPLQRGKGPGLFCIHPGPGLGWPYAVFIRVMAPGQPIYAIQARGLNNTDSMPTSLAEMIEDYATQIRRVQSEGPYHLVGWSSGGPIAYGVATVLQQQGALVGILASLDGYPPGPLYGENLPEKLPRDIAREMLKKTMRPYLMLDNFHNTLPPNLIDDMLLDAMLRVYCNTGHLLAKDKFGVFNGNLLLIQSTSTYENVPPPSAHVWYPFINGRVDVFEIACHHDAMLLPQHGEQIGRKLAEYMANT